MTGDECTHARTHAHRERDVKILHPYMSNCFSIVVWKETNQFSLLHVTGKMLKREVASKGGMRIVFLRERSNAGGLNADRSEVAITMPKSRSTFFLSLQHRNSLKQLFFILVRLLQVVDEVYDEKAANAMGLSKGSICVMLHSGSRGLGESRPCVHSSVEIFCFDS